MPESRLWAVEVGRCGESVPMQGAGSPRCMSGYAYLHKRVYVDICKYASPCDPDTLVAKVSRDE